MVRTGVAASLLVVVMSHPAGAEEWSRFRGPGGSGVLETSDLPVELGVDTNVRWKTALPAGHSSPVVADGRVFVTGFEEDALVTLGLSGEDGRVIWRREIPRPRKQSHHDENNPASPTPATDGRAVYAFFPDFGLIAYSVDGDELWRRPLGPFSSFQGVANSPVLAGDTLIQVCDQDSGSFLVVVDKGSGRVLRRVERYGPSYSSPVVHESDGRCEVILAGSGELAGYDCASAERLWWVSGLGVQPKSSPVVTTVDGDPVVVFHVLSIDNLDTLMPPFAEFLSEHDGNGDGRVTPQEAPFTTMLDADGNGFLDADEYAEVKSRARAPHTMLALRLGQRGDLTEKLLWRSNRGIPNVPTPIVYRDTLFVLKEGGILTSLDPGTGDVHKRGRLSGAIGQYYASPVASGGRLYLASLDGDVVVVKATPEWEVESVGALDEPIFATPAISGGRLYVRTPSALYCFGRSEVRGPAVGAASGGPAR